MTELFGQLGIAPGIGIIIASLALGGLAVLKIQDLIRQRGADLRSAERDDPDPEAIGRAVRKVINNALSTHLMKLDTQRAEWALDAQRAREQHERDFRAELWAGVDAIRDAVAKLPKGSA